MFGERPTRLAGNSARLLLILLTLWIGVSALPGTPGGSSSVQAAIPQVATWQRQSPLPTRANLNSVDMISATEGWAGGEPSTILHTTDSGLTWTAQSVPTTEPVYSIRFFDALHGIAGSNNTVLYTTTGGSLAGRERGCRLDLSGRNVRQHARLRYLWRPRPL